ncbi:MAG: hypothetical protein FJ110_05115 [Deltaproteobacteria bacterium]|nr:hypothetical protein [Deltaproteobacteria bacterium]
MAEWVKAGVVENRFEGDRISQSLSEAGIPFMVKSFLDTAYNGLYVPQKGWGVVMVPEEFKEQTEKIVNDIRKSFEKEGKDETE